MCVHSCAHKHTYILLLLLLSHSVVSNSVQPHRPQPTRLPRPWDSPGKNTGVVCHFLLQCMKVKSESEIAQWFPTLSNPMDCSPPGSSVHGIFQARGLEWGAIAFSNTYIHMYINVYICNRMYVYIYIYKTPVHSCLHKYTYTCMHINVYIWKCMYVCVYIYIHITHAYAYIHMC